MIRCALLGAALSLGLVAPAAAKDPRLSVRAYNPDEIVRIEGRLGVQASIAFADDEHIENVAIGDSTNWQITPNKRANLLFIKPTSLRARTNMTVVTDRYTYYFDLSASVAARPIYVLRFTYPNDPKPAPVGAGTLTTEEAQAITAPPSGQTTDPAALNFNWRTRGKAALLPSRVYDDGISTFLSWPVGAPIPAIQIRDETGTEGPVNFSVRGDVIVLDSVPDTVLLRNGRDLATLERGRKDAQPVPPSPAATPQTPTGGL